MTKAALRVKQITADEQCQVKYDQKTVNVFYTSMPEEWVNTQITQCQANIP